MKNALRALLITSFGLGAGAAAAQTVTLASTVPETGVNQIVVDALISGIEENVEGADVEVFLDGALGGERELLDLLRIGETDLHMGVIHASQYFPELDATLVPYLFPDYESIEAYLESEAGDRMKEALQERGRAKFLGTYYQGARWTTANKPIRTLDDLEGVKVRMPEIPLWIEIWSGMGATTTPMPSPEVFSGLQTGVIDAQENMLSNILGRRIHEVQDYLIGTRHQHSYVTIMANADFWESLDPEAQQAIQEAVDRATELGTEAAYEENQRVVDEIVASGVELVEPDPSFRAEAMPIIESAARGVLEDGVYEQAVQIIEETSGAPQ